MSADEVTALVKRISPLLAGRPPEMQGAVLADLMSLWLAGHYHAGPEFIELLIKMHMEAVRALLPVNIEMLKHRERKNAVT